MLGLPKSTEISKLLPKKDIYAKFQLNAATKEKIDADISKITIVNEISPNNISIPAGENVSSLFVLCIALKRKDFDDKSIITLSTLIPQKILFILEFENECKLATYHTKLMQTNWKPTQQCNIEFRGLTLDSIWENIVKEVGGLSMEQGNTVEEQIKRVDRRQMLEKEIAKYEKKARLERQPKKKFEFVEKVKRLNRELDMLS